MTNFWTALITVCLILPTFALGFEQKKRNFQPTEDFAIPANQNAALTAELQKHKRTIDFISGELKESGADFLVREAAASQFFLIGEVHGIAEVPQFTRALFRKISPSGYSRLVIETGSLTARNLEELAVRNNAAQAFADFDRKFPFALPFYNMKEEAAMLEDVVKNSLKSKNSLWGLDYEFIFSAEMHFKRLLELAPDTASRRIIEDYYNRASTEFEWFTQSKNPALLFIVNAKKQDWEKLKTALAAKEDSEAAEILGDLKTAQEIFLKKFVFGQVYESNSQRVELMKNRFVRYYNAAAQTEKLPKAVFKFGAIHTKRGRSYENLADIGSLAASLAEINGTKSFHLLVLPIAGTANLYRPFSAIEADRKKPFENAAFKPDEAADVKPLLSLAENPAQSFVVDLRPLRPLLDAKKFPEIDKGLEEIIWGYDAVLIIPQVKASELLN